MEPPSFPPPSVTGRVQDLGYGTGPWSRDRLIELWGAPNADKFIRDAKAAGWLMAPQRGSYWVPTVEELRTVSWLPDDHRQEYLIAQSLARYDMASWCLSAWTRRNGLDLGAPVFVTDLQNWSTTSGDPPWLDALLMVPKMPDMKQQPQIETYVLPESDGAKRRRAAMQGAAGFAFGAVSLLGWLLNKQTPDSTDLTDLIDKEDRARKLFYTLGSGPVDNEWIAAIASSLGIARFDELVVKMAEQDASLGRALIQQYANTIGPPQPSADWRTVLNEGPAPYLLVPPVLWKQMGPDQAARRAKNLSRLLEA